MSMTTMKLRRNNTMWRMRANCPRSSTNLHEALAKLTFERLTDCSLKERVLLKCQDRRVEKWKTNKGFYYGVIYLLTKLIITCWITSGYSIGNLSAIRASPPIPAKTCNGDWMGQVSSKDSSIIPSMHSSFGVRASSSGQLPSKSPWSRQWIRNN